MRKRLLFPIILVVLAFFGLFPLNSLCAQKEKPVAETEVLGAEDTGIKLTKEDVDTWLDGFMPYALLSGDIAGAVVVVVKDGKVLTARGFGYADVKKRRPVDPEKTLFRVGSVSKLFTWSAVMQLVEAGKLDLDADINNYLDFKIPPRDGQPITLRNLMTHTPGFAEAMKNLFVGSPERLQPLGQYVASWVPPRIFAPGQVPAYSNYGACLAGYIVERVSGESFYDYVEKHIFLPLGMNNSTFRQPLPDSLKDNMATGYLRASGKIIPFELVNSAPAGSVSASGTDMAKFMIAHLQDGKFGGTQILKEETAKQMRVSSRKLFPLNSMALGFYHDDYNGYEVLAHAGDTNAFHTDLHILPAKGVGIFISMNSLGRQGAAHTIRAALFRGFMDRYFPAPKPAISSIETAKEHGKLVSGLYWWSRRPAAGFLVMSNLLGQIKVKSLPDGALAVSALKNTAGAVRRWKEVAPFVWKDDSEDYSLVAEVKDGKVINLATDVLPPVMVLQPVPGWMSAAWNLPLFYVMIGILLLTVILWPVVALVRKHFQKPFPFSGSDARLYRLTRVAAILDLLGLLAYALLLSMLQSDRLFPDASADLMIRIAQIICLLGVIGTIVILWNAARAWKGKGRSRWNKISSTVIALAGLAFVWFVIILKLITINLNY